MHTKEFCHLWRGSIIDINISGIYADIFSFTNSDTHMKSVKRFFPFSYTLKIYRQTWQIYKWRNKKMRGAVIAWGQMEWCMLVTAARRNMYSDNAELNSLFRRHLRIFTNRNTTSGNILRDPNSGWSHAKTFILETQWESSSHGIQNICKALVLIISITVSAVLVSTDSFSHTNLERIFLIASHVRVTHEKQRVRVVPRRARSYKVQLHFGLLLKC